MQLNSLFSFLGKNPLSADGDSSGNAAQASSGFGAMLASTLATLAHRPVPAGPEASDHATSRDVEGHFEFVEADAASTASDGTAPDTPVDPADDGEKSLDGPVDEAASAAGNGRIDGAANSASQAGETSLRADVVGANSKTDSRGNDRPARFGEDISEDASAKGDAVGVSADKTRHRQISDDASHAANLDADADPVPAADVEPRGTGSKADASSQAPNRSESTSAGDAVRPRSSGGADASAVRNGGANGDANTGRAGGAADGDANTVHSIGDADSNAVVLNAAREEAGHSPHRAAGADGDANTVRSSGDTDTNTVAPNAAREEAGHSPHRAAGAGGDANAMRSSRDADSNAVPASVTGEEAGHSPHGAADASQKPTKGGTADSASHASEDADDRVKQGTAAVDGRTTRRPSSASSELEPSIRSTTGDGREQKGSNSTASGGEAAEGDRGTARANGAADPSAETSNPTPAASDRAERLRAAELERTARRLGAERTGVWSESSNKSAGREAPPSAAASAEGEASEPQIPALATTPLNGESDETKSAAAAAQAPSGDLAADDGAAMSTAHRETSRDEPASGDRGTRKSEAESGAAELPSPADTGGDDSGDLASEFDGEAADAFDQAAEELAPDIIEFEDILEVREASLEPDAQVEGHRTVSGREPVITSERSSSPTAHTHAAAAERAARPRHGTAAQWMHALLKDGVDGLSFDDDWKVLEMKLDEGQGTMTVRARRDEEKVSITVNFSDPQLRALAADQADRLQETLRAQYQTDVDFSLMNDNAGHSHPDGRPSQGGGSDANGGAIGRSQPLSGAERARATRAALAGARNEWIG